MIPEAGWDLLRERDSWLSNESKGGLEKDELGQISEALMQRPRLRGMRSARIAPPHIFS